MAARRKNKSNGAVIGNISSKDEEAPAKVFRNNDVDDGVIAFGMWLATQDEEKKKSPSLSSQVPIAVKEFVLDRLVVLYDQAMKRDVSVVFNDGVPSCRECSDSTDCAHVGFAICVEQMHRRTALE
jgi:hypothetical protein